MGRKRILLLDDNESYCQALKNAINNSKSGFYLEAFNTVEEAKKRMARGGIDLCLIDIRLKEGQSGIEIANLFRRQYPQVKLVLISMHEDLELDKYEFIDDILLKDMRPDDLVGCLHYALSGQEKAGRILASKWPALEDFFSAEFPVGLVNRKMTVDRFGQVEKFSLISGPKEAYVCINCYRLFSHPTDQVFLTLSAASGCSQHCLLCSSSSRPLRRAFTLEELMGQLRCLLRSQMIAEYANKSGRPPRLTVNFSGEGDILTDNPLNSSLFMVAVDRLFAGRTRFIATSVGNAAGLSLMKKHCLGLTLEHYWSVHSFDQARRDILQKGASISSLLEMRGLYEDFYQAQCQAQGREMPKITIAVVLLPGLNDREKDFDLMAAFVKGRPFRIKIMPYSRHEELNYDQIREKLEHFKLKADTRGFECRIRYNAGLIIRAGCGNMVFPPVSQEALEMREEIRNKLIGE